MVKTRDQLKAKNRLSRNSGWKSIRSLCCWFVVLCLNNTVANAQKLIFENIGVRSGLPSTEVYNLFQDHKGYLWIFTEYGMVKYNGSNYVPVCKNLSLKESAIYGVTSSTNGNIYISNSNGNIYRIHDDKAFKVIGIKKSIIDDIKKNGSVICDIFMDNKNGLYFSSFYKAYYLSPSQYYVKELPKEKIRKGSESKLYPLRVKSLKNKSNSYIPKVIDGNGVSKFDWFRTQASWSRLKAGIAKGVSYIALERRLLSRTADGKIRVLNFQSDVLNMKVDKNGHAWLSLLDGGLVEYDAQLNELDRYFNNTIVSDILFDNQSGMWVSTIGHGIYHCKDINQKSYSNIPGLKGGYINLLRVENHSLFAGTYSGDLFRVSGKGIEKININLGHFAVTDILHLGNNYLVTTSEEMLITDESFNVENVLKGARYGLLGMDKENVLVLSANDILVYSRIKRQFQPQGFTLPRGRSISKRFDNEYFVAVQSNGVIRSKNFNPSSPGYLYKLKNTHISKIIADKDDIWFCSKGDGLYCLSPKNRLSQFSELPSKIVNDICFTKANQLVIATNKGVFVTSRDSINSKSAWKLILNEESTRLLEFDGWLYIGTKNGLTSMNSNDLIFKKKYRFHLNSIFSRGKQMQLKKNPVFNYNQNDLYMNYDLLNYNSDEHQLEYRLEGPTQLNDVVSGTRLHLQNLTPGEYVLYVNPLMNNTKASELLVVTRFTIRPAFWQTWTFRIVVLILILSIIFLVFWTVNNRRNKKIREVNQIENLLTEYRLTALKSQVNPHFMSNSLVAIQRLILEEETDKANQYIAKFSLLLRSLLEYSNRSSATIGSELKMIELYVELEQLRFSHHFVFEIHIDDEINVDNTYMPALITQPFVENAIWHGLLPLNETRQAKLILSVTEYDNGIVVSVKDNGVGRDYNKEKKKHGEFESRGTSLIVQRMENLNRLYNSKEGRIDFIDLKDENGVPAGTEVNIVLPNEILNQLYDRRNS